MIRASVDMLNYVTDNTDIKQVPSVAKANKLMSSIGLGVMNLHGHLMYSGIRYGSDESLEFVDVLFSAMNYYTLKASNETAIEKNRTFYGFEGSDYSTGEYFKPYLKKEYTTTNPKVLKALGNIKPVTIKQWEELEESVKEHGLYNSYRNCTAPTGSISYIRSATASASPITQKVEIRDYGNSKTIYPMPFLTEENADEYITAYDMDMYEMVDLYATATRHIDQGMSMTLYITDQWTTEELAQLYIYAWASKIKTVYYVRQRTMTIEECIACSV